MPDLKEIYQFGFAAVMCVVLLFIHQRDMKALTEAVNKLAETVKFMSAVQDQTVVKLIDDLLKRLNREGN